MYICAFRIDLNKPIDYIIVGGKKMNWAMFWNVFILGEILVFLQGVASFRDEHFSEAQVSDAWNRKYYGICKQGREGYSFLQHGGMWADAFLITPLVAYLMAKYQFPFFSSMSNYILIGSFDLWVFLSIFIYAPAGKQMPEAHAHGGHLTMAGYIHILYATIASWIIAMVYISGLIIPPVSESDIFFISFILCVWAVLGVMKFTPKWELTTATIIQVILEVIGIFVLMWISVKC